MTPPIVPVLTPAQADATAARRAQLTAIVDALDDIRQALVRNPKDVGQLRRLAGVNDHLRDMLRLPREAVKR